MAGPSRIYQAYSDSELTAEMTALKLEMTNGTFTSVSGAAKSSNIRRMEIEDRMKSLLFEYRRRGLLSPRAQKVQSRFDDTGYTMGGSVTE